MYINLHTSFLLFNKTSKKSNALKTHDYEQVSLKAGRQNTPMVQPKSYIVRTNLSIPSNAL